MIGRKAVLLRGTSEAGKSRLAFQLLQFLSNKANTFCRLVADDQVHLQALGGRLVASPPLALAGLLELRGVGILRVPYEHQAQIGLVVDILEEGELVEKSARLPERADLMITIAGVELPFLQFAQHDLAAISVITQVMDCTGNNVENYWEGLAETTELVLSKKRK